MKNPIVVLLLCFLFCLPSQEADAQLYRFYSYAGADKEAVDPIWGWHFPLVYPIEFKPNFFEELEDDKIQWYPYLNVGVDWENIYMNNQLGIAETNGITSFPPNMDANKMFERQWFSYQSKHRYVNVVASFGLQAYYNLWMVGFTVGPKYMTHGNVKLRYTEGGEKVKDVFSYKDNENFYNFNRLQGEVNFQVQYSYFIASFGTELLPVFKDGLGPDLRKQYFSFGLTLNARDVERLTNYFEKFDPAGSGPPPPPPPIEMSY